MARHAIRYRSWSMANALARWEATWREHYRIIGGEEIWVRGLWRDLSVGKRHEDICIPCECLRVTSADEDINNQIDRMTHFVGTSQLLSPATNELMRKVRQEWKSCMSSAIGTFTNQGSLATAESLICQLQRPTLSP